MADVKDQMLIYRPRRENRGLMICEVWLRFQCQREDNSILLVADDGIPWLLCANFWNPNLLLRTSFFQEEKASAGLVKTPGVALGIPEQAVLKVSKYEGVARLYEFEGFMINGRRWCVDERCVTPH